MKKVYENVYICWLKSVKCSSFHYVLIRLPFHVVHPVKFCVHYGWKIDLSFISVCRSFHRSYRAPCKAAPHVQWHVVHIIMRNVFCIQTGRKKGNVIYLLIYSSVLKYSVISLSLFCLHTCRHHLWMLLNIKMRCEMLMCYLAVSKVRKQKLRSGIVLILLLCGIF